jgi:hypothetical protein
VPGRRAGGMVSWVPAASTSGARYPQGYGTARLAYRQQDGAAPLMRLFAAASLATYLPTTVADWITIGCCGTSPIGPRVVVGVASIFFTTSMPEVTLPNTA